MKSKKLFLIFIFGLFIFLFFPNTVFSQSQVYCGCTTPGGQCTWNYSAFTGGPTGSCLLKTAPQQQDGTTYECSDSDTKCKWNVCPDYSGWNGENCYLRIAELFSCWHIGPRWEANESNLIERNLKWDAYNRWCVECSGPKKIAKYGDTAGFYVDSRGNWLDGADIADVCESACGAVTECDEKNPGDSCGTGKSCNSSCQCETFAKSCSEACQDAGYYYGLCFYGSYTCSSAGYPYSSNSNCFHNCSPKTGTSCDGTCLCFNMDPSKPSCPSYSSGSTCYYNGVSTCTDSGWSSCSYEIDPNKPPSYYPEGNTCYYSCSVTCTNSGWLRSGCFNCNLGECCDCTSSGCSPGSSVSCTKSCSYKICSGGQCVSASENISGTKNCQSDCNYGECIATCPQDECSTDADCTVCAGTLNVSISGTGTCTVTAGLTATDCDGKSWQVKDDGTTKCSGIVSGSSYSYTCPSWTVGVGSYTYNLYIGGEWQGSKSVTCSEAPNNPPTCVYLNASPTSGDAPLTASFIGSGSDSDGNIVEYQLDFDGDGTWDFTGSVSPPEPNPVIGYNYTYDTPNIYTAKIRFKDDDDAWSDTPTACTQVISVTEPGVVINPPVVTTNEANPVETTSATLNGSLIDLGYDLAECPSCSCLVWFEWGTTLSYGNSTSVQTMTSPGNFSYTITNLDDNATYYFEAFAKNGGSW